MKGLLFLLFSVSCFLFSAAQQPPRPPIGAAPLRSEFIPFDTREGAETFDRARSSVVIPLDSIEVERLGDNALIMSAELTFPLTWIEREIYLHIGGEYGSAIVRVNGTPVGYTEDSPTEFPLAGHLREGPNAISIELDGPTPPSLTERYIYSQPPLCIHDFAVRADPTEAQLSLEITTSNSFNYSENIDVGYDIYDPAGKLVYYDRRERTLPGHGRDTMCFTAPIPAPQAWSPASPKRYRVTLILWREGRIVEYIPLHVGFRDADFAANLDIVRTAKSAEWGGFTSKAKSELSALKKQGVNLLRTKKPQPAAFYDLCDELGFWVVDQADIAPWVADPLDRRVGGTPANDPAYIPAWLYRAEAMVRRTSNHPCVVGWSLGEDIGNGYAMYRIYLKVKELDHSRPVIYAGAAGEWNTDM